jgi:hypothetical protein
VLQDLRRRPQRAAPHRRADRRHLLHDPRHRQASLFQEPPIPQMEIKVDREAAARYGVNVPTSPT